MSINQLYRSYMTDARHQAEVVSASRETIMGMDNAVRIERHANRQPNLIRQPTPPNENVDTTINTERAIEA
jgi:hypothetical protein